MKMLIWLGVGLYFFIYSASTSAATGSAQLSSKVKVAFLADIHLHDIFANITTTDAIQRPKLPGSQQPLLMRSMYAQLHSTRLFNENYFVFLQVLDELVAKNIRLVALPGDFTDDGQPINVRALARILEHYQTQYGMRFFAIPGNHDPVKPFTVAAGKADFLTAQGKEFAVFSEQHNNCKKPFTVCDEGLKNWGYKEILHSLNDFGFSQHKDDLIYETAYPQRMFSWCDEDNPQRCVAMPDASYLVEPVEGLWLLAIDANVYTPQWDTSPISFNKSSNAGYNALILAKPALVQWISDVVKRAKQHNKTLVAFSHFPMADFYDNANAQLQHVFTEQQFSLPRLPTASTAKTLADTGLTLHFAGHMHLNDTALITANDESQLVNVQVPSLAAYKAAYKVVELDLVTNRADIQTHTLDDVAQFDQLFAFYEAEWQYRHENKLENFDRSILAVNSYAELTQQHLFGLIEQRFLKRDWPLELATWLKTDPPLLAWFEQLRCEHKLAHVALPSEWITMPTMSWLHDFYLLRNGDVSAAVSAKKRAFYQQLHRVVKNEQCEIKTPRQKKLASLIAVMAKFSTVTIAERFSMDLSTGKIL